MEHPFSSGRMLSAFVNGGLDALTRREIVEHVSHCSDCHDRWNEAANRSSRYKGLRKYRRAAYSVVLLGVGALLIGRSISPPVIGGAAALNALVDASADLAYRPVLPRLSSGFSYRAPKDESRGDQRRGDVNLEVLQVAARISTAAEKEPTPENLHALGLSLILVGNFNQAIEVLKQAVRGDPSSFLYKSDLAAAHLARAVQSRDNADDYAAACEELSKLILLERSREPVVHFNLALAFEGLENRIAAERAWKDYLGLDDNSPWADEARHHLDSLRAASSGALPTVTSAMAVNSNWVCGEPLRTRRYVENDVLPQWAEATMLNDIAAASASLGVLNGAGEALQRCTTDRCLLSMATTLRSVAADRSGSVRVASAILALRAAHELARREQGRPAGAAYERASNALKDVGLPIHQLAAGHAAFQYYYIGDFVTARRLLDDAPRDEAGAPGWAAQLYWVDGMVHLAGGSPYRSLELYQKAADVFARIRDLRNAAMLEMLAAENLTILGASDEAWPHRLNALAALRRNGDTEHEQVALNEAAEAAMSAGHPFAALAYQQSAQHLVREDDDPSVETYGELWLALINERCGFREAATAALARAQDLAARVPGDDARGRVEADIDFAEGVIEQAENPYRSIALWSSALDYSRSVGSHYRAAQLLLARGRALRRLGQRERSRADLTAGIVELEAQRPLVENETLRTSFFGRGADLFDELISLLLEIGDSTAAYDIAERRRERTLLDAFEQNVHETPTTAAQIRETLKDEEVLLQYAVLSDGLVRWEVRRGGVKMSRVGLRAEELRRLIDTIYENRESGVITAQQKIALTSLRKTLIPFDTTQKPGGRLIIIPDSLLTRVPFAALMDETSFLVERYSIEVSPSASLFVACRRREHDLAATAGTGRSPRAFVFGDTRGVSKMSLAPLRGATMELREAALALNTVPITGGDATKPTFLRGAPTADIIYVAGHAVAGAVSARPALVMAVDRAEGGDLLAIEEIRQSHLRGRLVVLAACGTAVNQGEGVTSLARAFLVAGVPAVAGSLLSVDDRATQRLLAPFAREVVRGRSPSDALRHVQLAALNRDRSGDPLSWAGFQIYGSASLPISAGS